LTVHFSAAGSEDPEDKIASYVWSMPDMTLASGVETTFTFKKYGEFQVLLTVTDNLNDSDSDAITIAVSPSDSSHASSDSKGVCGCVIGSDDQPLDRSFMIALGLALLSAIRTRKNHGKNPAGRTRAQ